MFIYSAHDTNGTFTSVFIMHTFPLYLMCVGCSAA